MPRILVIDDNPEILMVVRAALEGAGHEVVSTEFPEESLTLAASIPVQVVVLDVMMPGMSGTELLRLLRKIPGKEQLPILFLSALSDTESRIKGLKLGADDYLGKPFEPAELVARVERLAARNQPADSGLSGDLASFALSSLLQSLADHRSSGTLDISGGDTVGTIRLHHGQLVEARCRRLEGRDAALTLLTATDGRFRFTAAADGGQPAEPPAHLAVNALLLEAAWTDDEISRRREHLPASAAQLRVVSSSPPSIPADFQGVPITAAFEALLAGSAHSLAELTALDLAGPRRLELAVAWLIEGGWLSATEQDVDALRDFLLAAKERGASADDLTLLVCYDASTWSNVLKLLDSTAAAWLEDPSSFDVLLTTGRGSVPLHHAEGDLLIHVQPNRREEASSFLSDLESQAALVFWLGDESRHLPPQALLQGALDLPADRPALLIATGTTNRNLARRLELQHPRWRAVTPAPATMADLLALLHR